MYPLGRSPHSAAVVRQERLDVKAVFRNGWSHPGRVRGWAKGSVYGEFADPDCRSAWLDAMRLVTMDLDAAGTEALDMGNGPGTVTQLWAELGLRASGLDFSHEMIATAKRAADERGLSIDFSEGDVEHPPFAAGRFGVVSSRLVLFTLPHPGYAIRRWAKLLRPGGRLVLIGEDFPNKGDRNTPPADKADRPRKERPPGSWQADETYKQALRQIPFMNHTKDELRVVMEAAGLGRIHALPMDAVIAAREALVAREPGFRVFSSKPYVLVGFRDDE